VRERVDPIELIDIALDIARGRPRVRDLVYLRQCTEAGAKGLPPPPMEGVEVVWPSIADSQAAMNFLRSSGWQMPTQSIELTQGDGETMLDYSRLSPEELDALETSLAKAAGILDVAMRSRPSAMLAPAQPQDATEPEPAALVDPLGILR
jgi:hypothetical protein